MLWILLWVTTRYSCQVAVGSNRVKSRSLAKEKPFTTAYKKNLKVRCYVDLRYFFRAREQNRHAGRPFLLAIS